MLFLLFINDIISSAPAVKFFLFVDDRTVFAFSDCFSNLVTPTNNALRKVESWLVRYRLIMNEDKIYFVVFHLLQRAYLIFTTLYLRYSAVKRVDNIDFLVVHFH